MTYELMQGDCLVEMTKIADGSVDMICADLPYGTTQNSWDVVIPFGALWKHYERIIKPDGAIILFSSQPFTSLLIASKIEWFRQEIIWDKVLPVGFLDANRRHLRQHENIILFSKSGYTTFNPQKTKGNPYKKGKRALTSNYGKYIQMPGANLSGDRCPTSIVKISNADRSKDGHPTQKPTLLLEYLILTYTNEGETVLDNCFGSGSCGVAAMRTKRRFVGIERDETYFAIGSTQIADAARAATGLPKVLQGKSTDTAGLPMFEAYA